MLFQYVEHPKSGELFRLRISEYQGRIKLILYLNGKLITNQEFDQIEFLPPFQIPFNSTGQEFTVILEDEFEKKQKSWIVG